MNKKTLTIISILAIIIIATTPLVYAKFRPQPGWLRGNKVRVFFPQEYSVDEKSYVCHGFLAGNEEEKSLQILREGLRDVPGHIEIYGSERVEDSDFIGGRMLELVKQYRKENIG